MGLTAKLITPIASNTPDLIRETACNGGPLNSGSTAAPLKTTVATMMHIDTSAIDQHRYFGERQEDIPNPDDFDSLTISRCKLNGNDTASVQTTMMNLLSTSRRRPACSAKTGKR